MGDTSIDTLGSTELLQETGIAPIAPASDSWPVMDDPTAFLADDSLPTDYAVLPRRRIRVKCRGIRSRERAELEKRLEERRGSKKQTKEMNLALFREWLCIYGAVRENGAQMFGTEHLQKLRNLASADINAIAECISKLSGITDDDVEDMVGNSESSHSTS